MANMYNVQASEIPEIRALYHDLWQLTNKYWNGDNTEEYWGQLIDDAAKLAVTHNSNFGKRLIVGLLEAFEAERISAGRESDP